MSKEMKKNEQNFMYFSEKLFDKNELSKKR